MRSSGGGSEIGADFCFHGEFAADWTSRGHAPGKV